MRSSEEEEDQPLFAPLDWMLALGVVLCALAWLIHSLLSTPAASYAATAPPPLRAGTLSHDLQPQERLLAQIRQHAQTVTLDAWHAQVVHDAQVKAAKVKAQVAAQQAQQQSGGAISTAGFSSFKACVAMRESTDGQGSSNIYGILGGLWPGVPSNAWYSIALPYSSAWSAPASVQSQVFDMIYAADGPGPWAPYDGC